MSEKENVNPTMAEVPAEPSGRPRALWGGHRRNPPRIHPQARPLLPRPVPCKDVEEEAEAVPGNGGL